MDQTNPTNNKKKLNCLVGKDLVKISALWFYEAILTILTHFETLSRTKYTSTSKCFVFSWKTGLRANLMVEPLWKNTFTGNKSLNS